MSYSKRIRGEFRLGDERHRRFMREAEITAQLEHPNIVPVYDTGIIPANGCPFYTMPLLSGTDLQIAITPSKSHGKSHLTARQRGLVNVLLKVCDAVEYAHKRGVFHRDIKPSNIHLGKNGEGIST